MQALKGQTDNAWANQESMYGWFAYIYHWTPEQIDKIPYDRLTYLMVTYKENKMRENKE